jgi:inner membrane protein
MDPIAHTLLGAAMARTRLGRDRPLAMPVLVLASNAPDIDVVAYFWSSDVALAFRRGLTHGPLGLALLPLLVVWVVWIVGKRWRTESGANFERIARERASFSALVALSYVAMLTHPALDWLNTYGVRFLYPFDRRWFYGDTLFIVDPWVWLLLGAGVILGARVGASSRKATVGWAALAVLASAMLLTAADSIPGKMVWLSGVGAVAAVQVAGRPSTERGRRRLAGVCVALFATYVALSVGAAVASRSLVRRVVGEPIERLMVGPLPLTPARREAVAITNNELRYGRFRWLASPRFEWVDWSRPLPPRSPVLDAAWNDPSIRGFAGWARFPWAEIDEHPDFWEVHFMDARYTLERGARFGSVMVRVPRNAASNDSP